MRPTTEAASSIRQPLSSTDARFSPYEPNVEANQKEHEVDDAPQSQQFWRNGKPKKRNGQVSNIEIRVYPRANKKRAGEKFTDLFPITVILITRHSPTELWNGVNDFGRKHFRHVSYGSIETRPSQQQFRPCRRCPNTDRGLRYSEISRCATSRLMHRSGSFIRSPRWHSAMSGGGTVRPITLAVLRLMISLGRPAGPAVRTGLSPLRIRPV